MYPQRIFFIILAFFYKQLQKNISVLRSLDLEYILKPFEIV